MILDTYFPGWENASLHESSPSNDFLSRYSSAYSDSQFFEDAAPGTRVGGVRNENLEKMTFDDNTFDLFITQDVFEHVLNPQVAAKEILRVLKPGGAHIFTTPKHRTIEMSRTRVERVEGKIEDLFVPEFHGNPVGDGRSLVTWDYGRDFEELFTAWSGGTTVTYVTRDRSLGLEGEFLEVFVNRKPSR
jgi:SAM-dependent methyltransferase